MIRSFCAANGQELLLQELKADDALSLYLFFRGLSAQSSSRFAPHASDYNTIRQLAEQPDSTCLRYIARARGADPVLAYFLFQMELFPWEEKRFREAGCSVEHAALLAPAIADRWQGGGLGALIYSQIEPLLIEKGIRQLYLWGGVQSDNVQACRFYQKIGFREFNRFYHEGRENTDMVKQLIG